MEMAEQITCGWLGFWRRWNRQELWPREMGRDSRRGAHFGGLGFILKKCRGFYKNVDVGHLSKRVPYRSGDRS